MPINPVQFAHEVCDEFLRYLFSAFPLSDPDLARQARQLLERPSSLDIPLVKGPFVSLSEAFAKGDLVKKMAEQGLLHHAMPGLIGYATMWKHQEQVFDSVKKGRHVLVATGTGSGKTEAFLYPIVDDFLRQRDSGVNEGLAAILVYPMNALANDQLDRLRSVLAGTGITFGQWVGTTPDTASRAGIERFEGSRDAYLDERKRRREEAREEDRAAPPLAPPEECCSEQEIRERKPRILLTNFRQLEVLTTRLPDVELFAKAPLRYLVFDEAHTYSGATGAEVACLIRRLRALAGKKPDEVICVGTSATLTDPSGKDADSDQAARRFASRFFGIDAERVTLVGESYVSREWPKRRYRPVAPPGDGMARLTRLLEALEEPVNGDAITQVVGELTGQLFDPGACWEEALFDHLVSNEYVFQSTEVLRHPNRLHEAAWATSQRVGMGRLPQGERANAEMLTYLILEAAARKGDESLLRPKVHFFLRGLDEMVVAFDGKAGAVRPQLHLSLGDARGQYAGRRDDAFFPVLTCRTCGQHFLERHYRGLEFSRGSRNQILGFENGDAVEDGDDNAVWPTAPVEAGKRLLLTDRLLEDADLPSGPSSDGPATARSSAARTQRRPRAYVCRQCGAMHRKPSGRCLADGCGHPEPLVELIAFGDRLSSCPSCGTPSFQIGGRPIEPARRIQAVTVSDVHILAQAMINAAPDGHKKLIIFADSRQDAAFQAGWMQDHARRIRLRHMMFQVIRDAAAPLSLEDITDRLMEAFRSQESLIDTLLPELTGEEAEAVFGRNKWVPVRTALRYMTVREFSTGVRRVDCLESMGLARVCYQGLESGHDAVVRWAAQLGISPDEAVEAVSLILDGWRRSRTFYIPGDPIYSRYHKKDNEYVQAGLLPLRDFSPQGWLLQPDQSNRYARGLLATRGTTAVQALARRWAGGRQDFDVDAAVTELWGLLTSDLKLLCRVTLRSQNDRPLGADVWQLDASKVGVRVAASRERCTVCQRVTAHRAPRSLCTGHHCKGSTVTQLPDEGNYDVWLMNQPFVMVNPEEHTAQVPGEVRNKIEQDFKSRQGRTNCLVATPTLEMGVNIGDLDMALLRNVPPKSSNYWQRAGRAGREERMAVVVTYCRRNNHDRYFFDDPLRLLGGAIEAPTFNLRNPLMVAKHVRSAALSELLLQSRSEGSRAEKVRETLGLLFPTFIRSYLLDDKDHFRECPTSVAPLQGLLDEAQNSFVDRLSRLFAGHWPAEAAELVQPSALREIVADTGKALAAVIGRLHQRLRWALSNQAELNSRQQQRLLEPEERQLLRRCEEYVRGITQRDRSTYTLTVLAVEGFLPGYGVYEGGITASARRGFARQGGPRTFDLSRGNVVALREFVPGNRLYANRGTYYVARYHLVADQTGRIRTLRVDPAKGYVTDQAGDSSAYGQSGAVGIEALPLTDLDLAHESRITEDENLRFSMPVLVLGRLRKPHRGGRQYRAGDQEISHLRGQSVELVNLGEAGRVRAGELGHLICSVCGAAKSPYSTDDEVTRFTKFHKERCGKEPGRLALTVHAEVDVLQFHGLADEAAGINIGEALRAAATRVLDMGPDDIQLLLVRKPDDKLDLLLYDPMPGGSGLLQQMLDRWPELVAAAREVLAGCVQGCDKACYSCLKTFRNQFHHPHLDRLKGLELLADLDHAPEAYRDIPAVVEEEAADGGSPSNPGEAKLKRLLEEHHFPPGEFRKRIEITKRLATWPDWVYEPKKVALYLDGVKLHDEPANAQQDQIIRYALSEEDYKIVVIQTSALNDPQTMRLHLRTLAEAIERHDLPATWGQTATLAVVPAAAGPGADLEERLRFCGDDWCKSLIQRCAGERKPLPEVGHELRDPEGRVTEHMAELAWPEAGVAVVLGGEDAAAAAFAEEGWRVFRPEDPDAAQTILDLLTE